jgi:[acyl-carrier-protein] S-malonyltransferase
MKTAMLFPGYGSQYVGMAKELYDNSRLMQEYFEEASHCLNVNFVKLCFASSESELSKLEHAYESIFLVSSAIASMLAQRSIPVDLVAGFGLGEYAALCAAGGLNLPDGLYFLSKYAQLYQDFLNTFGCRSLQVDNLSCEKLTNACKNQVKCAISATFSDDSHIVSGYAPGVSALEECVLKDGAEVNDMPIEAGLYSALMNPVAGQLEKYLEKIDIADLSVPLCMAVDGSIITSGAQVRERILKSLQTMISWDLVMKELESCDILIEIGPGSMLSSHIKKYYPEKKIYTINKPSDLDDIEKGYSQVSHKESSEESSKIDL